MEKKIYMPEPGEQAIKESPKERMATLEQMKKDLEFLREMTPRGFTPADALKLDEVENELRRLRGY